MRFLAIFLLLTASATQLAAQDPVAHLVRDIDPTSYAGSSRPRDLVDVGNGLSFTAFGRTELWVVDLRQGTVGAVLRGAEIRPLGADLYAVRDDSGLWTLNMLVRFRLGVYLASIPGGPFVRIGEPIEPEGFWGPRVFAADDGTGEALWIVGAYGPDASNGRAVEIARPAPLPSGRLARNVVAISGGTAFVARSPNGALGFWVTDGTAAGTHSILPAPGAELRDVVIVGHLGGGTAVLLVDDPHARCNGKQLWLSDGTAGGTRPLLPALDGPCLQVSSAVAFYDRILAIGDDGVHGREIWRSDGTAAGTAAVTNFRPRDPFGARPLTAVDREGDVGVVFFADDGVHGREPWVTEVTRGSARLLADLCPGPCASDGEVRTFADHNGPRLLLSVSMPDTGEEPWVTDGTRNGTRALGDLCPGSCGSAIDDVVGGWTTDFLALFTAESPVGSRGQWITDGTVAGTRRLTPANVQVVRGASNGWVFAARDAAYGEELWQAGLTPETTTLWYDLERERDSGSYPRALGAAGNLLVFTAFDAAHGRRLWRSDGSFAGTAPIPGSGPAGFEIGESASAGGHVFYTGRAPEAEVSALWATNAGARRAARVTPRGVAVRSHLHAIGPRVFFVADDALHGYELWVSAGTRETTHLVRDMVPGHGSSRLAPVEGSLAGQFVFARDRAPHVWISDGSEAGTRPLAEEFPALAALERSRGVVRIFEALGKVFFALVDASGSEQLWASDGTSGGSELLVDGSYGAPVLLQSGSRVFFVTEIRDEATGEYARRLLVTDGTRAGTLILPTTIYSYFSDYQVPPVALGGGLVYPNAEHQAWFSDGVPEGTGPLLDAAGAPIEFTPNAGVLGDRLLMAGVYGLERCRVWSPGGRVHELDDAPLCVGPLTAVGSRLFFTGFTPRLGAELWSFTKP